MLQRYRLTPARAVARVMDAVETLGEHGCAPTFPTPGRVVQRHPQFFRDLQAAGAEIAVHSYDHIDLSTYSPARARRQLLRASDAFTRLGIESRGFRCPYLRCTGALLDALPPGVFEYSSNQAIEWDGVTDGKSAGARQGASDVLRRLYAPLSAREAISMPWMHSGLVEIPVSLPDDLELYDSRHVGSAGMAETWDRILRQTHERGELFVLMFHPELAWRCQEAFASLLRLAARLQPAVWVARLRDVSAWWREKASFTADVLPTEEGLRIVFACSDRGTILVKGLEGDAAASPWHGTYQRLEHRVLDVPFGPRPLVGLPATAPDRTVSFLREQGYIVDTGETASQCATYLDSAALAELETEVQLIAAIEASPGPLVRYGPWPDGARSALCVSGDLDALSLLDYGYRLIAR